MFDQVRNRKEFFTFCYIFIIKITYSRNYGANITFFELEHSGNQFFSCYPGPFKAQLDGIDEKYNENAEWGGTGYSVKKARLCVMMARFVTL